MSQSWKENQWVYISEIIGLTQTKGKQPYTSSESRRRRKKKNRFLGMTCWLSLVPMKQPCSAPVYSVSVLVGPPVAAVASKEVHAADSRLGVTQARLWLALQTSAL